MTTDEQDDLKQSAKAVANLFINVVGIHRLAKYLKGELSGKEVARQMRGDGK